MDSDSEQASPECPVAMRGGADRGNVPMENVHTASSFSSAVPVPERQVQLESLAPEEVQGGPTGIDNSDATATAVSEVPSTCSSRPWLPADGEEVSFDERRLMKEEVNRLETFQNWPKILIVSPVDLAQAGFYYQDIGDQVQCAFCHNGVREWEAGATPMEEHRRHFPYCPFVLGLNVGNVPLAVPTMVTVTSPRVQQGHPHPGHQEGRQEGQQDGHPVLPVQDLIRPHVPGPVLEIDDEGRVESREDVLRELTSMEIRSQAGHRRPRASNVSTPQGAVGDTGSSPLDEMLDEVEKCSEDLRGSTWEPLMNELKNYVTLHQCKVCLNREANVIFEHCGHLVCCEVCASDLSKCPVCRCTKGQPKRVVKG